MAIKQLQELCALFFITVWISASNVNSDNIRVSSEIAIIRVDPDHPSTLGVTGGLRSCGGPGQVVQMRYEACNGESPCRVPRGEKRRPAEFEFIPSRDIPALGVRINVVTENGTGIALDRPLTNSAVIAGHAYNCVATGGPARDTTGLLTIQWILYQVENNEVEVCGEVDYLVVDD